MGRNPPTAILSNFSKKSSIFNIGYKFEKLNVLLASYARKKIAGFGFWGQ